MDATSLADRLSADIRRYARQAVEAAGDPARSLEHALAVTNLEAVALQLAGLVARAEQVVAAEELTSKVDHRAEWLRPAVIPPRPRLTVVPSPEKP